MKKLIQEVKDYTSLVKFSHTIFAMPFAMIGFFYGIKQTGEELPRPLYDFSAGLAANLDILTDTIFVKLLLIMFCMITARNAAMAFNRYTDREIDRENPRTCNREIPAGVIKERNALRFVIVNSLLFIVGTAFLNPLAFYLSPIVLITLLGYSYTKRFTWLCHMFLGLSLGMAPIGAYIAVTGDISLFIMLISLAVIAWVCGFDIIYALQDEEFDREHHLFSIPAFLGRNRSLVVSAMLHGITFFTLLALGCMYHMNWVYWTGTALFSLILLYEHIVVTPKDISRVNLSFATLNGIGSVIFAIFTNLSFINM